MTAQTKGRGCGNKKRHAARRGAEDQILRLQDRFGSAPGEYRTYECPHCGSWHVGHRGRPQREKRKR